jgi:hypothetical protein
MVESSQGRFNARGIAILPGGASSGDAAETGELRRQGQLVCLYLQIHPSGPDLRNNLQVVVHNAVQRAKGPLQLGRGGVLSWTEQGNR